MPKVEKPFLQRLIERITGKKFAAWDDPRIMECKPLLVTGEDDEIVFSGPATIEFTPKSRSSGRLKAIEPKGKFPDIWTYRCTTSYSGGRAKTPNGLRYKGRGRDRVRYTWHINGAAIAFMKRKVRERWAPGKEEV